VVVPGISLKLITRNETHSNSYGKSTQLE